MYLNFRAHVHVVLAGTLVIFVNVCTFMTIILPLFKYEIAKLTMSESSQRYVYKLIYIDDCIVNPTWHRFEIVYLQHIFKHFNAHFMKMSRIINRKQHYLISILLASRDQWDKMATSKQFVKLKKIIFYKITHHNPTLYCIFTIKIIEIWMKLNV